MVFLLEVGMLFQPGLVYFLPALVLGRVFPEIQ
jgi:hypothetical protein